VVCVVCVCVCLCVWSLPHTARSILADGPLVPIRYETA